MIKREKGLLALFVLTLGLLMTACDSWMSGDHFFDTVAEEVKYANAEKIKVYVRYPTTTWGTTSPNGNSQQKVDIPFSVTAVDNSEYGFYKWAAFSTTGTDGYSTANGRHNIQLIESEAKFEEQYGAKVLGEDEVVFEDPYSPTTIVRVLNNRNDVFIMPICVRRPFLSSTMPSSNQVGAAKNTTIQLVFSNPMDPAYLLFGDDEQPYESNTTDVIDAYLNTSNIFVEQVLSSGENPYNADITGKLRYDNGTLYTGSVKLSASLNKSRKTLTIKLPSDLYWPNGTIMVSVSQTVQDNLGFSMSSDGQVTFNVGNDMDTIPPNVIKLEAGTTTLIDNSQSNVYPRVGKTINIRAVITDTTKTSDPPSEGNVNTLDYWMYLGNELIESGNQTYSQAVNFTEVGNPKAELNATQRGMGVVFPVKFANTDGGFDGQYKLLVRGVDNVGNFVNLSNPIQDTDDTEAGVKFIFFIKDTRAPSVENINSKISAVNETWAPYGWYGREGLGHIEVKQASPGAIIDEPSSNPDPQYRSDKVWWAFRVGDWSSTETWRTDMKKDESIWDGTKWNEVTSDPQPLGAVDPDSVSEGIVSIYALLKDDVGNVSEAAQLNSVQYDGTAPAIGTMEWITENGIPKGFTGGNVLSTHTLAIPFTESLSGIKKIAIEVQPPSGAAGIMPWKKAFESDSIYAKRKNYNGNYYGVSFTKSMNAAGVQELILTNAATSSTSETYQNTLYLDNLTISNGTLVDGDYTLKVKLYDQALNVAEEKSVVISVDSVAPAVQKLLVEEAAQFAEEASDPTDDDTYRYFLTKDAYDTSRHAVKTTLDINVKEQTSGIYTLTLGNDAYITSSSTVTVADSSGSPITAAYTKDLSTNTVTFMEKLKVRDANALGVTIKITNVELRGSEYGQKVISVSVKDYATLTHNNYNRLSFENDSDTYANISLDGYTSCTPYAPSDFVVTGSSSDAEGYAKETGVKASLTIPSGSSYASGLKKITFTGLKVKSVANYGPYATSVKLSGSTSNLGYTIDDDGNALVLNYPIVNTSSITLEFMNLELTSLTQGSNTLSAKYEYLAGWESPAKTTTVIYDNVAPVVGSSTLQMGWVVRGSETEIPGVSNSATVNNQYLMIPVTETNSGVRKIKIEVEKDGTSTTDASCESLIFFGYSDTSSSDSYGGGIEQAIANTASGNEITISDPVTHGKHKYYYIRGIKISDSATMEEGNYTLHVTLYDYAGNVSGEKTIDMCNDHTKPVVQDTWFDGVKNTANKRTYTTNSENNTLFVKVTESGSGIQKILLNHPFSYDPYVNALSGCRVISTSDSTKLYYSVDGGATFTEVACTRSGSRPNYYLTVANADAIKAPAGSDIILKITGLSILDADYVTECAASVGVRFTDLAQNLSNYDDTHNNDETNKNLAAIAEDCDPADVHQTTTYPITMWDSEKVLQGTSLVAESGTRSAYSDYTNNPLVNIRCVMNEWVNLPRTPQSGLRAIVLEGATFTEQTEIEWKELYKPQPQDYWDWPGINSCYLDEPTHLHRHGSVLTGTYKGSKDSIAEVPFAMNTKDFYLVGNNILVLETPVSVGNDGYVELRYVKLDNTTSDGTKTVKVKVYDVAGTYPKSDGTLDDSINKNAGRNHAHSDWPEEHEASKSITYCGTAPTITVASTGGDPEAITAADIQKLVPRNNGLQAYAEGTTVWVFSHSSQDNRRGANTTPSGNGVYLGRSYCPYFDLDITPSTAANLRWYQWTNSATVPASGWNSSSSVNVNFPTSGDLPAASVTAMDWYLHVADYAGNVTTKKMSQCQWINETVASAWPKRNGTGESGKKMEDGAYYLESTGIYATDIPKLTVTLPAGASGDVKVYIPTNWFNKVCDNGAPIYGYAIGNHTRYDEGHTDISKATFDANGPYLEIPQSYITEANAQSTKIAGFYFYVYDAVGQDLTAVVEVTVDNTPPVLEVGVLQDPSESPESGVYTIWKGSSYVNSTKTRFNVESDGSRHIRQYVDSAHESTTKGASATNPIELYVNKNNPEIKLWTNSTDVLKFTCAVDGADASEVTIANNDSNGLYTNYYRISPNITETGKLYKFSAVDKGANESSIYIKAYYDHEGPIVSMTGVQNVYTKEDKNYFSDSSKANFSVTDSLSGLYKVNGTVVSSYSGEATLKDFYSSSSHTLNLSAEDYFGNTSSIISYNGISQWYLDNAAPVVNVKTGSTTGCFPIGSTLYFKDNTATLELEITDNGGSGVKEGSGLLKNGDVITLSDYLSGTTLTIPGPSGGKRVEDNVGNTRTYELISNLVQDTAAPSAPTALTNAYSSDGKACLSGSNKVFYNASANSIQLTLSGAEDPSGGSGLAGYVINGTNYPYDTGYPTKVTISRNEGSFPGSITIKSYDGVGNVSSTGLTVTLVEDAAEPTVTATYSNSDSGTVYKSGDTVYFKGSPTVILTISDGSGSGLASGFLQNGDTITLNSSYYDATNKCLKINSGMIKDNLGNTKEYTLNVGKLIKDESGPSVGSSNFTTGTGITIGTESTSSTNPVTWYKSGYYLYIEGCEVGGSGLAYWQVGTSTTKQTTGTFISSTAEDEDGKITLPTSITTPTVLYIYAEDHLGNSNYCKLSTIDGDYKDKWCYNDATAPAAPVITAVSSVEATVGGSSSSDYAYLDGANSKLYYNGSATALTVTMSSTLPDGVVGYSLTNVAGSTPSTELSVTSVPTEIKIYAFDYKGNVSSSLKLTPYRDETAPTFTMPSTLTGVDKVRVNNDSWMVNTFQAGNTQITFTISDDGGSGLAGYAFVKKEEDYNYTGSISFTAATGISITITLPDTNHYNTNFMLLLKDNVGNVTKADDSGSYESSAAVKTGSDGSKTGFWSSIPLSPSFSASYQIADDKKSVDITLSGVDFPVSSIKVTAAGISALRDNKCNMKERRNGETNEYSPTGTNYNNGTGTISLGDKYLSYDKTISFTFTGENIEAPTEIKINDTYTAGTLASFSLISGFGRFSRRPIRIIDDNEDIVEGPELVQQPVRNPTFADYFGRGLQPLQDIAKEDAPVAFNVGKNMLAVEESVREMPVEKAVTIDLEDGYIAEDLDAENQVVQNLAWKAPDGPVLEENEVEGQELALNMASESSASGKVLSARDAAGVQEEKEGWNPALILALVSMLALGIVALFVRKRR